MFNIFGYFITIYYKAQLKICLLTIWINEQYCKYGEVAKTRMWQNFNEFLCVWKEPKLIYRSLEKKSPKENKKKKYKNYQFNRFLSIKSSKLVGMPEYFNSQQTKFIGLFLNIKYVTLKQKLWLNQLCISNSEYLVRDPVQAALPSNKKQNAKFFLNTFGSALPWDPRGPGSYSKFLQSPLMIDLWMEEYQILMKFTYFTWKGSRRLAQD